MSDKAAAASAGITHTLGTLSMASGSLTVAAGGNVAGGSPAVAFGNLTLSLTTGGSSTLIPTTAVLTTASATSLAATAKADTLNLDGTSTGNAITGAITNGGGGGTLSLTKQNTSTWTVSGSGDTYTGTTSVTGGVLIVTAPNLGTQVPTVTGGTLQIGNNAAAGNLNTNVSVTTPGNLGFYRSDAFTFGYNITGTGAVTQLGGNSLTLTSAGNTFSGGLNINAGSVIDGNPNVNTIGTGTVALANNTTLDLHGNSPTTGLLATSGNGTGATIANNVSSTASTLTLNAAGTQTFAGAIVDNTGTGGTLALTKTGTGVQVLSGNSNTFSGVTDVGAGVLRLGSASPLSPNSNVQLTTTGILELGYGNVSLAVGTGGGQVQVLGTTTGFGAYGGDHTLNLGTVTWGSASFNPATALQLGSTTSNGKLILAGTIDLGGVATRTVNAVHGSAAGPDAEISGTITSVSGRLVLKINTGVGVTGLLKLSGANTYDGQTWVNQGGIEVASIGNWVAGNTTATNLGAPTTATNGKIILGHGAGSNLNPGTLRYVGSGETTNRTISLGGGSGDNGGIRGIVDASGSGPLVAPIVYGTSGTGSACYLTLTGSNTGNNTDNGAFNDSTGSTAGVSTITKSGAGTWLLNNAASTYAGGTIISAGTLVVQGNEGASSFGLTGTFTNGGGTITGVSTGDIANVHVGDVVFGALTNGNLCLSVTAVNTGTGTVGLNGTASVVSGTYSFEDSTASGILGKSHGALTLGDTATTANNSSPALMIGGAYTIAHPITIANQATTGTYTLGGNADSTPALSGLITINQPLTVSQAATTGSDALYLTGGITAGAASHETVTFTGPGEINVNTTAISDNGGNAMAVSVTGGTTTLAGTNSYTGATTISGGTLQTSVTNALPTGTAVTLSTTAPAVLNLTGGGQTLASLSGGGPTAGNVVITSGGLTLTGASNFAGPINLNGGLLTVTGTDTSTFSGQISGSRRRGESLRQ